MDATPRTSRVTAISGLIAAHVTGGIASAVFSADQQAFSSGVFIALIVGQATLIGMWCGLGQTRGWARLLVLFAAIPLLGTELGLGIDELHSPVYWLVAIAASLVALATWLARLWKVRLAPVGEAGPTSREGLQFGIKHLLGLTFVVACLVSLGKALAPFFHSAEMLATVGALGACFVAVALASLWAMLGLGRTAFRLGVVAGIAVAAGALGGYLLPNTEHGFWIFVAAAEALLIVASLAVFRALGYRLLARG